MTIKMFRRLIPVCVLGIALLAGPGCFVNRHVVNNGPTGKRGLVKYDQRRKVYLFWGLVGLGKGRLATPADCGYQIKTSNNAWDMLIYGLTGGIVGSRTQKVLVSRDSPCAR